MNGQYTIIAEKPTTILSPNGVPTDAVEITFQFGDNRQGRVKVTQQEYLDGKAKMRIEEYVTAAQQFSG